jgi:hypothetical protein
MLAYISAHSADLLQIVSYVVLAASMSYAGSWVTTI